MVQNLHKHWRDAGMAGSRGTMKIWIVKSRETRKEVIRERKEEMTDESKES